MNEADNSDLLAGVTIPGLPGMWRQIGERYNYDDDKVKCPACGGLGFPWGGWFSCDDCPCKAVVEDGRAFLPQAS